MYRQEKSLIIRLSFGPDYQISLWTGLSDFIGPRIPEHRFHNHNNTNPLIIHLPIF